jgi:hypothetical protein
MCKPQVKAETAKKLVLEFISITEEGIDDIEIQDEYLKLTIQGLRKLRPSQRFDRLSNNVRS